MKFLFFFQISVKFCKCWKFTSVYRPTADARLIKNYKNRLEHTINLLKLISLNNVFVTSTKYYDQNIITKFSVIFT